LLSLTFTGSEKAPADSFPDIARLEAAISADERALGGLQPLFDEEELELDSLESSESSTFDSSDEEGEEGDVEDDPSKVVCYCMDKLLPR
jgi:hypothetical protein